MDATAFLKKRIKFYLRAILALYIPIGFLVAMFVPSQLPNFSGIVGFVGGVYQIAMVILVLLSGPLFVFGIVLLVFALQITSRTAKIYPEFKKTGLISALAAAAYLPLSVALLVVLMPLQNWYTTTGLPLEYARYFLYLVNPITLGLGLLIQHHVAIGQARELVFADLPAVGEKI